MFLSRRYELNVDDYIVKKGWVLLSRSGTIGNALIVSPELEGKAVANHAIRIIPNNNSIGSFLYLFLTGAIGRTVVSSLMYGSVVDEIKPAQLDDLQLPLPSHDTLNRLALLIERSIAAKGESVGLLRNASVRVLEVNALPVLSNPSAAITNDLPQPTTFALPSKTVVEDADKMSDRRLDANFYNPTAQLAVANVKKCRCEVKMVGDVAERIFFCNRFARTYVEKDHGMPYLAGKNIVQIRPTDLAYLSRSQTENLDQYRLQRGWILMTCSGTLGRTCLVWKNYEQFVATHDLIRIVPNSSKLDGGYLYAFLSSDYGKTQVVRYRHGSVIDHITPEQVQRVLIPVPYRNDQETIGNMVREAYEKRAEAIRLEDEAQAILMNELTRRKE
jgi:type I restriction enzyme S subunit